MTRLIVWGVVATMLEAAGTFGVVHTLLRYAMTERGLATWRVSDTLLTSPLLWTGVTLAAAALNWLVAGAVLRGERAGMAGGATVAAALVLAGAVMAWFGLRAVGKLY